MTDHPPLVTALVPPYAPDVGDMLKKWMPPGAPFEPLYLFRVLAKAPDLMAAMRSLGSYFLGRQTLLSVRLREVIILRACAVAQCAYEWGVHVAGFAAQAGLDAATLQDLYSRGADAPRWTGEERAALMATDEIVALQRISPDTRFHLTAHFDEETRLAIIVLAGWYGIIASIANSCCPAPEPWAGGFPGAAG